MDVFSFPGNYPALGGSSHDGRFLFNNQWLGSPLSGVVGPLLNRLCKHPGDTKVFVPQTIITSKHILDIYKACWFGLVGNCGECLGIPFLKIQEEKS